MSKFALPVRIVEGGFDILEIDVDLTMSASIPEGESAPVLDSYELTIRNADKIFAAFDDIIAHPGRALVYKMEQTVNLTMSVAGQEHVTPWYCLYEMGCTPMGFNPDRQVLDSQVYTIFVDTSEHSSFGSNILLFSMVFKMDTADDRYCNIDITLPDFADPEQTQHFDPQMMRSSLDENGTFHYIETSD